MPAQPLIPLVAFGAAARNHATAKERRLQPAEAPVSCRRVNAAFLSGAFVRGGGGAKGVLPKGPERGPLSPRDPFAKVLKRFEHSQRADMAVRAPVRSGQQALSAQRPAKTHVKNGIAFRIGDGQILPFQSRGV